VAIGEPAERWLLASDAGYGFIVKLEDLHSRQRAGKAVLNLTANAKVLIPVPIAGAKAVIAAVNSEGQMLVFPSDELPEMARGKGNKMFGIPTKKAESREETLVAVVTLVEGQKLVVWCGERSMTLSWKELEPHRGARAQRGAMLSRNYRKVDRLEVTGG
jgi:topoisomerase-4 subunit A